MFNSSSSEMEDSVCIPPLHSPSRKEPEDLMERGPQLRELSLEYRLGTSSSASALPSPGTPRQYFNRNRAAVITTTTDDASLNTVPSPIKHRAAQLEETNQRFSVRVQEVAETEGFNTDLVEALRAKEVEASGAVMALAAAEVSHKKAIERLQQQLQEEQTARAKAEKDVDELLDKATEVTPRTSGIRSRSSLVPQGDQASRASISSGTTSDAFWVKMREREERARGRVRKEYVQQMQNEVFVEQKRREEAERLSEEADRRARAAEERSLAAGQATQRTAEALELLKVELHERELGAEELRGKISALERHVVMLERAAEAEKSLSAGVQSQLEDLARQREEALQAQRDFAKELQSQLGVKDRDLLDKEAAHGGVLSEIKALQARCEGVEAEFVEEMKGRQYEWERLLAQKDALTSALQSRCDELQGRCDAALSAAEGDNSMRARHARELDFQRQSHESQLNALRVEHRSLELQAERTAAAMKQLSRDNAAQREAVRQERESFLRRYTAEASALEEELDRTKALLSRAKERHLKEVLELSEQISNLKESNTKLEYAVNYIGHDEAEATRLLMDARAEVGQLRLERSRASITTPSFHGPSHGPSHGSRWTMDTMLNGPGDARVPAGAEEALGGLNRSPVSTSSLTTVTAPSTVVERLRIRCAGLEEELRQLRAIAASRASATQPPPAPVSATPTSLAGLLKLTVEAVEDEQLRANARGDRAGLAHYMDCLRQLHGLCLEVLGLHDTDCSSSSHVSNVPYGGSANRNRNSEVASRATSWFLSNEQPVALFANSAASLRKSPERHQVPGSGQPTSEASHRSSTNSGTGRMQLVAEPDWEVVHEDARPSSVTQGSEVDTALTTTSSFSFNYAPESPFSPPARPPPPARAQRR